MRRGCLRAKLLVQQEEWRAIEEDRDVPAAQRARVRDMRQQIERDDEAAAIEGDAGRVGAGESFVESEQGPLPLGSLRTEAA